MDAYLGQEKQGTFVHFRRAEVRLIKPEEAASLLEIATEEPDGHAASFLLSAASEGWKVDYKRQAGLVPNYDEVVGRAIINNLHENPVNRAYGALVALSLGIELVGDGK